MVALNKREKFLQKKSAHLVELELRQKHQHEQRRKTAMEIVQCNMEAANLKAKRRNEESILLVNERIKNMNLAADDARMREQSNQDRRNQRRECDLQLTQEIKLHEKKKFESKQQEMEYFSKKKGETEACDEECKNYINLT